MKKMVIFGAGRYGRTAVQYYSGIQSIAFIVDNSKSLWGSHLMGIVVKSPEVLKDIDKDEFFILLAVGSKSENVIIEQLKEYGFKFYVKFNVNYDVKSILSFPNVGGNKRIVSFSSGLGNQLFQYAFYKSLYQSNEVPLYADLSKFLFATREFLLDKVFTGVSLNFNPLGTIDKKYADGPLLVEEYQGMSSPPSEANLSVLSLKQGYFTGYWQSYRYPQIAESDLRKELIFISKKDCKLNAFINNLVKNGNTVSLHVRRGDYLSKACVDDFGNICTVKYYEQSVRYIRSKVSEARFLIFSEDTEWCRKNLNIPNSIIIIRDMFDDYEDWYDMYLMSLCKHNIIANSTFSWWGAWLNNNQNKIVIAPKQWRRDVDVKDICPLEWVRI